jgi:hypothetical protein
MAARRRSTAVMLLLVVVLTGCGRAQGVSDTEDALERAGYRDVEVSLRTGGGIGVARVEAAPGGPPPERAAELAWRLIPVRFDQLVVAVDSQAESYGYEDLVARFGPRDPSLDRRQIDEDVVRDGLELMLLLALGALLSVGLVVALAVGALRAARRVRGQEAGPTSGLGEGSLTLGASETAEGDEIPS